MNAIATEFFKTNGGTPTAGEVMLVEKALEAAWRDGIAHILSKLSMRLAQGHGVTIHPMLDGPVIPLANLKKILEEIR